MIRIALVLLLAMTMPLSAQDSATSGTGAVLRGLDKVNGRSQDLTLPTGQSGSLFGLEVELIDCRYPSENPTGDAFAYLLIRDEGASATQFEGWMIASSPALNALDHSRYDVWVLRCMTS